MPKHVFNNVQSKSRWWKKDFGSKSVKLFEKDVFGCYLTVFFEDYCWFGPKIFLPPSWFWLDIIEDMFRHILPYTLKFFKNVLLFEIIFWKLQLQISDLDLWPARLLKWAKLKRTLKPNFWWKPQVSSTIFSGAMVIFFQKTRKTQNFDLNFNEGVLWPSWHCCENFKVVTQTFATVQLVLNFTWKRPK